MQKQVLITGGANGIGRAIAIIYMERGDRVFVFDCLAPTNENVITLVALGIFYVQVNIASVTSIKAGFKVLSLTTLDVLVNNAGISIDSLALRIDEVLWDNVLDVNLKGAFFCTQQALRLLCRQKISYIINISSIVALRGNAGQTHYAASKAGLIGLTKSFAREYASKNILVNAIAPGFIQTNMTTSLSNSIQQNILSSIPLKRFGSSHDVAYLVDFLTSGHADYMTGQIIELAGGM